MAATGIPPGASVARTAILDPLQEYRVGEEPEEYGMSEHLNYCRSMAKQFTETLNRKGVPQLTQQALSNALDLYTASQKFILPEGGRILDDAAFKALDENEELKLPFPFIALEYSNHGPTSPGTSPSSKRIVFARDREEGIVVTIAFYADVHRLWGLIPELLIPKTGYIDRRVKDHEGNVGIKVACSYPEVPSDDFMDEIGALMNFLNALQCRNVSIEKSAPVKGTKKIKSPFPFDTYHILTVDVNGQQHTGECLGGTHRSPREHLRRGHIRCYPNGVKVWVNATVVNAGKGFHKVAKTYRVRGVA